MNKILNLVQIWKTLLHFLNKVLITFLTFLKAFGFFKFLDILKAFGFFKIIDVLKASGIFKLFKLFKLFRTYFYYLLFSIFNFLGLFLFFNNEFADKINSLFFAIVLPNLDFCSKIQDITVLFLIALLVSDLILIILHYFGFNLMSTFFYASVIYIYKVIYKALYLNSLYLLNNSFVQIQRNLQKSDLYQIYSPRTLGQEDKYANISLDDFFEFLQANGYWEANKICEYLDIYLDLKKHKDIEVAVEVPINVVNEGVSGSAFMDFCYSSGALVYDHKWVILAIIVSVISSNYLYSYYFGTSLFTAISTSCTAGWNFLTGCLSSETSVDKPTSIEIPPTEAGQSLQSQIIEMQDKLTKINEIQKAHEADIKYLFGRSELSESIVKDLDEKYTGLVTELVDLRFEMPNPEASAELTNAFNNAPNIVGKMANLSTQDAPNIVGKMANLSTLDASDILDQAFDEFQKLYEESEGSFETACDKLLNDNKVPTPVANPFDNLHEISKESNSDILEASKFRNKE